MNDVNIGMIGAGFMGKAHALAYATMPMFFWPPPATPKRRMIADVNASLAREAATRYGFDASTDDWRRIIDDPDIDVVDIVTPNDSHAEIALAAAAAGKHVLCEKPLARSAPEAATMADAVDAAGVIHMVAFNYRRTPAVVLARKLIDEGAIGRVLDLRVANLQDGFADPSSPLSWRFQRDRAGSGALGDIATHALDFGQYLAGDITAVCGLLQTYVHERPPLDAFAAGGSRPVHPSPTTEPVTGRVEVDDQAIALLRFASGAVGSLEASRNAWGRHNHLAFEVHGSTGSISFNYERRDELNLFLAEDPPDRRGFRTIYTGPEHPYGESLWPIPALGIGFGETKVIECHDFLRAIADDVLPEPNFHHGLQLARVTDALTVSSASQGWIEVAGDVMLTEPGARPSHEPGSRN